MHNQKRLLLLNLNEVYATFKRDNPEFKIGISYFPTWDLNIALQSEHMVHILFVFVNSPKREVNGCSALLFEKMTYHDLLEPGAVQEGLGPSGKL